MRFRIPWFYISIDPAVQAQMDRIERALRQSTEQGKGITMKLDDISGNLDTLATAATAVTTAVGSLKAERDAAVAEADPVKLDAINAKISGVTDALNAALAALAPPVATPAA